MKINPRVKYYLSKGTASINIIFAVAFMITMASCYVDYYRKLQKDPTLPWFAMFLQVKPQYSWNTASPFHKVNSPFSHL